MTLLNPEDRASNRLLAHLPQEDQERLSQFLEPVVLEYKLPLYDADQRIEFVHFIESGVGSLVCAMANGQAAEIGTVGNEGFAGLPVLLGDDNAGGDAPLHARLFQSSRPNCRLRTLSFAGTALLPVAADDA